MSEIEIGEYARTKNGYLGKLIAINKQDYNYLVVDTTRQIRNDEYPATYLYLKNEDILKHSKNIIDLIEVGDIVNNQYVKATYLEGVTKYIKLQNAYENGEGTRTYSEDIKSILTHEQYKQNCYEVEG